MNNILIVASGFVIGFVVGQVYVYIKYRHLLKKHIVGDANGKKQ